MNASRFSPLALAVLAAALTPGTAAADPGNAVFGLVAPVHGTAAPGTGASPWSSLLGLLGVGSPAQARPQAPADLSAGLGEAEFRAELARRAQDACDRPAWDPARARRAEARMPWILEAFDARDRATGQMVYRPEQRMMLGMERLQEAFATVEPLAPGTAGCYRDWAEASLARHDRFSAAGTDDLERQQLLAVRDAAQAAPAGVPGAGRSPAKGAGGA